MSTTEKPAPLALAALLIGATAIGFAPIFTRISPVAPIATGFWRMLLALPIFYLLMRREHAAAAPATFAKPWHVLALALPGVFFAGDMGFWNTSVNTTSIANSTLLTNISPIFVALMSWLVFKERFTRIFLLGMAAAIAGALMLMGSSFQFNPEHLLGDFLGASSGIFYGSYLLSLSKLRRRFGTAHLMCFTSVAACPVLLIAAWCMGQHFFWEGPQLQGWSILFALAIVSHVGGQGLIAYALAHLPVTFSAVGLLLQPVVASIVAIFAFGEGLSLLQAAGGLVVLTGVFLCRVGSAPKAEHLEEKYE